MDKKKALTSKQEKFCQGVIKGLSYSDAYREAYDAKKMKAETINRNAASLMQNNKIATRVEELKKETTLGIKYTVEDSFNNLSMIQKMALDYGNLPTALKAEELKGKLKGLYIEKKEITGIDLSPIDIVLSKSKS